MKDILKVVVTGTSRCGTRYFSKRLTSAGIPCRHDLINLDGLRGLRDKVRTFGVVADSSWLAAAYLQHIPKEVQVVQLVRHPAKVIESLMRMKLFYKGTPFQPYKDFVIYHSLPDLTAFKPLDLAIYFYVNWNRKIVDRVQGRLITHRIEDDDTDLLKTLGATTLTNLFSDKTDNTRAGKPYTINWDTADTGLLRDLKQYSEELGYNLKEEYSA